MRHTRRRRKGRAGVRHSRRRRKALGRQGVGQACDIPGAGARRWAGKALSARGRAGVRHSRRRRKGPGRRINAARRHLEACKRQGHIPSSRARSGWCKRGRRHRPRVREGARSGWAQGLRRRSPLRRRGRGGGGGLFPVRRKTRPSLHATSCAQPTGAHARQQRRKRAGTARGLPCPSLCLGREGPGPSRPFPLFRQGRPGASGCT